MSGILIKKKHMAEMVKRVLRYVYYLGYKAAKVYWFVFRPKAFGVKCVVQCGEEILLIRNSYGPKGWTFPGGGIHAGEPLPTAAVREVREEVGIFIQGPVPLGSFLTTKEYKKDFIECFTATVDKKDFTIDNEEVVEARWFRVSEMPALTNTGLHTYNLFCQHAQ